MSESPGLSKVNLYPLAYLAVFFATGIVFESTKSFHPSLLIAGASITSFAAFLLRERRAGTVMICAAFLFFGAWCSFRETSSIGDDRIRTLIDGGLIPSGAPVVLEGSLSSAPEPTSDGYIVMLDVQTLSYRGNSQTVSGRVRIYLLLFDAESASELNDLKLRYGSHLSVACELSREQQFQNPGVPSRIELLDRQSIDAVATIKSPLLIEPLGDDSVFLPLAWVYDLRHHLLQQFRERFSPSTAGVLSASMLGDKYFLDKSTAEIFRQGGTFHVLVISGLHITFIGGLLLLVVSGFTRNLLVRFLIVSSALWAYALAVGCEAPVVRAVLMFTILLFSSVINRRGSLLNSLGFCVLVLLVWKPSDIFDPSLQLTLLSVAAIVCIAFPLIEKLRSIGAWMPSASTPFPPDVPRWLARFCEMLYWKPIAWDIETSRQIWSAHIIKQPYLSILAARRWQTLIARLFEGLLVSIIVQAWLLPLLIIYFHRITPVSVVMNLWVGPVIAFESFAALGGVILGTFSDFLAAPIFSLTEFLNYLLSAAPSAFLGNNWTSWRIPNYSGPFAWIYIVYFIPLGAVTICLWQWDVFHISIRTFTIAVFELKLKFQVLVISAATVSGVLVAILVFHPFSAPRPDGRLHIDFLDVGQGDSAFITFPDGKTMLVDGGGRIEFRKASDDDPSADFVQDSPGIGEAVVSPVLWNRGYSHIDYILATHADADHIQGLIDVAANFDIGEALFGREPQDDPEFAALKSVLDRRGFPARLISRGQSMSFGGATIEVLYPLPNAAPDAPSDNDHSVVIRIVYGRRAFLLTGDIEDGAENVLVHGGGTLKADVIKIPHHGSRTSSTPKFVEAVAPEFGVISVGRHSRFGHPHKEVIERWLTAGATLMTTGEKGMISVSTDGKEINIRSFLNSSQ